jgi:hypothetical protein
MCRETRKRNALVRVRAGSSHPSIHPNKTCGARESEREKREGDAIARLYPRQERQRGGVPVMKRTKLWDLGVS